MHPVSEYALELSLCVRGVFLYVLLLRFLCRTFRINFIFFIGKTKTVKITGFCAVGDTSVESHPLALSPCRLRGTTHRTDLSATVLGGASSVLLDAS